MRYSHGFVQVSGVGAILVLPPRRLRILLVGLLRSERNHSCLDKENIMGSMKEHVKSAYYDARWVVVAYVVGYCTRWYVGS